MSTATQQEYFTRTERRYKCPVHHGKKPSVSVGFIDGRAWAKCWSQGCAQSDILAALGITNSPSIPWTPPPAPRPRPAFNVDYLLPVSPNAASKYLEGILRHRLARQSSTNATTDRLVVIGGATPSGETQASLATAGNLGGLTQWTPSTAAAICLAEGEKDAAILAVAGLIAFAAPQRCPKPTQCRLHRTWWT